MFAHRGHAPQDTGAKALISAQGLEFGTVGGGKDEAKAISLVQKLLAQSHLEESEKLFQVKWNLQHDVGMTQGHGTDMPILKTILKDFVPPYIGVIGSKVKALKIKNELKAEDFSEAYKRQ